MKTLKLWSVVFLLTIPLFINAQNASAGKYSDKSFRDRLFTGGDLGLQFGDITLIDIRPLIGYKITDSWAVGITATYIYYKDSYYDYKTNIYGGSIFTRYYVEIIDNVFLHGEYEVLNYDAPYLDMSGHIYYKRITANNVLIGGGYSFPLGENSSVDLLLLYNLNENEQSLYSNPIIRVGLNLGL